MTDDRSLVHAHPRPASDSGRQRYSTVTDLTNPLASFFFFFFFVSLSLKSSVAQAMSLILLSLRLPEFRRFDLSVSDFHGKLLLVTLSSVSDDMRVTLREKKFRVELKKQPQQACESVLVALSPLLALCT